MKIIQVISNSVITPRSSNADEQRQEFILNIILAGFLIAALIALSFSTISLLSPTATHYPNTFVVTAVFTAGICGLLLMSRLGHFKSAASIFIGFLLLVSLQMLWQWGYLLPSALLLLVMIIVIAGVLLGARQGLIYAVVSALLLIGVSYLDEAEILTPDTRWLNEPFHVADAVSYTTIFAIISLVSWLSNREIDRSLQRARHSEQELAAERDSLEIKVANRTRELEDNQLVRMIELQRFAEFGRLSANLLHEIANPLTAATLNLALMDPTQSSLVRQVRQNLNHLERYVAAARQQLCANGEVTTFSVRREINQLLRMLEPRAASQGIKIVYQQNAHYSLRADPVKFSQLVANLLVNSMDAYSSVTKSAPHRQITLRVTRSEAFIIIEVSDNGSGISKDQLLHVFEPFFTTKTATNRSLGIGLAMVKQYVEQDFKGSINAVSDKKAGTTFTVRLKQGIATGKP